MAAGAVSSWKRTVFEWFSNDFLPAGKIKKSKGPPDSSRPASMSTKSHVLSGINAKSHVLSGTSAKSHVLSGISAKGHVLSGISAKSHVLSGLFWPREKGGGGPP